MAQILQSSTYTRSFLMIWNSDHVTGATSAGPAVYLSKSGTSMVAASGSSNQVLLQGTIPAVNGGMYYITLSPADTNTLGDLVYLCTATNCDPTNFIDQITAWNPASNSFVAGTTAQPVNITGGTISAVTGYVQLVNTGVNVTQWASGTCPAVVTTGEPIVTLANGTYNASINIAGGTQTFNQAGTVSNAVGSFTLAAGTYAVNLTGSVNNVIQSIVTGTIAQSPLLVAGGTIGLVNLTTTASSVTNTVSLTAGTYAVNLTGSVNNVIQATTTTITGGTISGVTNPVTLASGVNVTQWAGGTIVASTVTGVPTVMVVSGTVNNITGNVAGSVNSVVQSVTAGTTVNLANGTYPINISGSVNNVVQGQAVSVGSVNVSQWAGGTLVTPITVGIPLVNVTGGTVVNVVNPVNITGGTISAVTGAVNSVTNPVAVSGGTISGVLNPVGITAGTYAINIGGSVNNVITAPPSGGGVNVTQWAGGTVTPSTVTGVPTVMAVSGTINTVTNPVIVSGGTVNISTQQLYVKQNAALNGFMFLMVLSADHVTPATGLTITSQVSINGGAFGATTNSATEISNGVYTINLSAADTNGHTLMFLFSSATADNRYIEVVTQV